MAGEVQAALSLAREREELGAFWALEDGAGAQAGTPVAVKDLFDVRGLPTTGGLRGPAEPATADAGLVQRLRGAGAVPIGKTAMDVLGLTTSGQAPGHPPCVNPVDLRLSPGGSSSGSAVAVAAGIVRFGLGTDTAGSVRIPAAYCGIAGLKPALGRLRRNGMLPVMGQWDVPGVLAPTVQECISFHEILAGSPAPKAGNALLRIGILEDLLEDSDPEVTALCRSAAERLGRRFRVEPVELGWRGKGYGVILACEFEAIWGERVDAEPRRFPKLAREMVATGRKAGPKGFAGVAATVNAERDRIRRRLGGFDAFLCPTVPIPAPDRDDESVAVSSAFTRIFSALGWPAASVPAGEVGGRPVGIQVTSLPSRFGAMLAVARELDAGAAVGKPAPPRA